MTKREVVHLRSRDARLLPWKNGRGTTRELAIWPSDSSFERGNFDLRISKASITESGPFSSFQCFDRILVVVGGDGLVLSHGDRAPRVRLRRLEPYRFSGDWPTTAALGDGSVADFNVITRRASSTADVQALRLGERRAREPLAAEHVFVHALTGALTLRVTGEEDPFALSPEESLWLRGMRSTDELDLRGASADCELLIVRVHAASAG